MRMADRFREQAAACSQLGSPMYAELLARVADDIDAGGVVPHASSPDTRTTPARPRSALRLAGSVHRLVLDGQARELATFYPSTGGHWDVIPGWKERSRSCFATRG